MIAACFVVNYVTADAKTNWAEGYSMVCFYIMIVGVILFISFNTDTDDGFEGTCVVVLYGPDVYSQYAGLYER